MNPDSFWHVTVANIITWTLLSTGFGASFWLSVKLLGARMDGIEKWRDAHETEAGDRDKLIQKLEIATEKLTVLAEVATKRLETIESRKR